MSTEKHAGAEVVENITPELVATPTKDACRMASSPQQLLPMILAFLETFTGTEWQGQCEGSTFEEEEEWTTAKVSLSFRVPTKVVIDEFADND